MADFQFKKGAIVEISIEEVGFSGAWFPGTVIDPPTKNCRNVTVEYKTLLSDENNSTPLREDLDLVQIRPTPPREIFRVFNLDEEVDAFRNGCWWEGIITRVLDNGRFSVYFRPTREQSDFKSSELRLHREWVHGKWVPPLEEKAVKLLTELKFHEQKQNKLFIPGKSVEVSSDEDGLQGAWFPATVVEITVKNYLIEYKNFSTEDDFDGDDDSQSSREEIDALHIRPSPPETGRIEKFKLYEEVDAYYNDGWWFGIISKVHDDSKFAVFFKTTNEEIEFKRGDIRLHQDWIDGKWVSAA